ncbi:MAG: polysaccharide pyruvyl transferase family protein [Bacteroides thetaiotaomicron]|nr:polysaccharide pyruvyl transferase family protein [Bacteroides thetaiotaomicron]
MIGLCIKYFHENYGGMLQAYATTKILEDMGLEYELIRYEKNDSVIKKIKYIPRLLNGVLLNDKYEALRKKNGMRKHPEFAKNDQIRMQAFSEFKDSHFTKISPVFVGYDALCKGTERYKAIITGSDQLWRPAGLPTNFYNLMYVPDNIRKISYASSFGVKQIPWYQKFRTRQFLNRIDYISMRENRGSEIVKELTGREVQTILDPVLMYDGEGWERLIPCEEVVEGAYIFAYFLGTNPEHRKAVEQVAQKTGLKVVALRHLDQYVEEDENFGDYALYDIGPDRFLNLLRGAQYVCTDSFHGSCFSIIHEKNFMVFNRYDEQSRHSKNSRIDTLCQNLGLSSRRYTGNIETIDDPIDYTEVNKNLHLQRDDAWEYLNSALDGIN